MTEEDDIEKVKRGLDLERIISSQASDWQEGSGSAGRRGRCTHPVHGHTGSGDNAGNLIVTDDGWYCYSHETGGDVLDWIAVEEGVTSCRDPHPSGDEFAEVLRTAADRAGVKLSNSSTDFEDLSKERKAELDLMEIVEHLHGELGTVLDGMTIRKTLKERRGFSDADIDNAKIGWIDDQVYADLLREYGPEALERTGFRTEDGNQFVSGRIIYPYLKQGKPRYWTGRATQESSFEKAKYRKPRGDCPLTQPVHTVRPPESAPSPGVWIVEGIQDAISMASNGGVKAITAVATNPSGEQRRQLFDVCRGADHAVVCFDSDDSGVSKSIDLSLELMSEGVQTEIASVPRGDDPNDFFTRGGKFDEIEPTPAVEKIIEERGDADPTLDRILSTLKPETLRSDRAVNTISEMTGIRKRTLRKRLRETRRMETSSGWKEPTSVRKRGRSDVEWVFVYDDGTEIVMDSIGGRDAYSTFRDKYTAAFNFYPRFKRDEFDEMLNRWLDTVTIEQVQPLSTEGMVREKTMEMIETTTAVPDKDDLSSVSGDAVSYWNDGEELLVLRDTLTEWLSDFDASARQLSEYLAPIKCGSTKRLQVGDTRRRFWTFDPEAISEKGYTPPEVQSLPDHGDAVDPAATEEADEL